MKKRVLLLGGTGVMGYYTTRELIAMGYAVDVVSLDSPVSWDASLRFIQADAKNLQFLDQLLKNEYDAIIDFLIYGTKPFEAAHRLLLSHTQHYIFLSSYRVYANEQHPITEDAPQLVDVATEAEFLASDDYSLHKARSEHTILKSGFTNWTIVRPAITYSAQRMQLVSLEANTFVNRAKAGKPVLIPEDACSIQATMSWGGDVGKMLARLVLNKDALCQAYTVSTAEHQSWQTVAEYYQKLIGLQTIPIEKEAFIALQTENEYQRYKWQLEYDRLYDRIVDNSKILNVTGLKQSEFMPLFDGLKFSLEQSKGFEPFEDIDRRMDAYLEKNGLIV